MSKDEPGRSEACVLNSDADVVLPVRWVARGESTGLAAGEQRACAVLVDRAADEEAQYRCGMLIVSPYVHHSGDVALSTQDAEQNVGNRGDFVSTMRQSN